MVTSGLEWGAFGAARTANGDVWLAYVVANIDWVVEYVEYDIDGWATCVGNIGADESSAELQLVRIAPGKEPEEVFVLPLPAIAGESPFSGIYVEHPLVDVRARGSEITVGVRAQASRVGPFTARVLRVDPSLLALP